MSGTPLSSALLYSPKVASRRSAQARQDTRLRSFSHIRKPRETGQLYAFNDYTIRLLPARVW
jgi:hypothetical protein